MDEIDVHYQQCEDCCCKVDIMLMIVKETSDGNCIYCPKCVEHHKFLAEEEKRLCLLWGINVNKFAKETEKAEKKLLKQKK
jgi:hypothetical protein